MIELLNIEHISENSKVGSNTKCPQQIKCNIFNKLINFYIIYI